MKSKPFYKAKIIALWVLLATFSVAAGGSTGGASYTGGTSGGTRASGGSISSGGTIGSGGVLGTTGAGGSTSCCSCCIPDAGIDVGASGTLTEWKSLGVEKSAFLVYPVVRGSWVVSTNNIVTYVNPSGATNNYTIAQASCGPFGFATSSDGSLWFSEGSCPEVGRITIAGDITHRAVSSSKGTRSMKKGPDGRMWFLEDGSAVGAIVP